MKLDFHHTNIDRIDYAHPFTKWDNETDYTVWAMLDEPS
jgi:hypothetical protein